MVFWTLGLATRNTYRSRSLQGGKRVGALSRRRIFVCSCRRRKCEESASETGRHHAFARVYLPKLLRRDSPEDVECSSFRRQSLSALFSPARQCSPRCRICLARYDPESGPFVNIDILDGKPILTHVSGRLIQFPVVGVESASLHRALRKRTHTRADRNLERRTSERLTILASVDSAEMSLSPPCCSAHILPPLCLFPHLRKLSVLPCQTIPERFRLV